MAELKTKENDGSVNAFLKSIEDENKRADSYKINQIMEELSGAEGKMWGDSIIGYGNYHYTYKSGKEGNWFYCGFSPRKQAITLYIMTGFSHYQEVLDRIGKYKTGKACLYIKRLSDVDEEVLKELISSSIDFLKKRNPT